MKSFFKNLFTDKSFYAALAALVTCGLIAANKSGMVTQITTIIGGVGTIIAYIINNAIQTAAETKAEAQKEIAKLSK